MQIFGFGRGINRPSSGSRCRARSSRCTVTSTSRLHRRLQGSPGPALSLGFECSPPRLVGLNALPFSIHVDTCDRSDSIGRDKCELQPRSARPRFIMPKGTLASAPTGAHPILNEISNSKRSCVRFFASDDWKLRARHCTVERTLRLEVVYTTEAEKLATRCGIAANEAIDTD